MEATETKLTELPKHEVIRMCGQLAVQSGLFLIALSTVLKSLGHLPDVPLGSTGAGFNSSNTNNNTSHAKSSGYFD